MEKPNMNQTFDRRIREALQSKASEAAPSGTLFARINAEVNDKERENLTMNQILKIKRAKPVIIAALILILTAATSFAASQISSLVSTSKEAFDEFPTKQQVEKAVNYIPDYVESFSNGFYFKDASIRNTAALDNDNNKVNEGTGIAFYYTRDNAQEGQSLSLNTDPDFPGLVGDVTSNQEEISYGDIKMIYSQVTYKVVPEGYVPTEEENRKVDQGKLWISYGSEKAESSILQYVTWVKDGVVYDLMDQGFGLGKDELLDMAKEVLAGDAD